MNQQTVHVGIDVSKEHLDISPFDDGPLRVKNTASGISALLNRLNSKAVVCCEASGGYEKLLCAHAPACGDRNRQRECTPGAQLRRFPWNHGEDR